MDVEELMETLFSYQPDVKFNDIKALKCFAFVF